MSEILSREYNLEDIEDFKSFLLKKAGDIANETISQGVTFNDLVFSMSTNAQLNWSNLPQIPEDKFPLTINTKDDLTSYELAYSDRMAFWAAALNCKNNALQAANTLKQSIRECTTIEELQTISDSL